MTASKAEFLRAVESFLRSKGAKTRLYKNALLASIENVPIVFEIDEVEGFLRISALSEIEVSEEGILRVLLEKNFHYAGIKISLDPEGFIVISIEERYECVASRMASYVEFAIGKVLRAYGDVSSIAKRNTA
uniref:Uncharacterized protein n=1 Tax=Fervidicoccus fontis TaxID=683846 RepID=A0A7J3ZLC4_9CREN